MHIEFDGYSGSFFIQCPHSQITFNDGQGIIATTQNGTIFDHIS